MRRPTLFHWYYDQGIHGVLEIWRNYLLFAWRHFSLADMLKTLFSPWHRDVSVRSWRGWNPAKSFGLFLENLLSRLIGAVVRSFVLIFGLIFFLFVFLAGILAVFFWISAPLLFIALLWAVARGAVDPVWLGAFVLWGFFLIAAYFTDTRKPFLQMGFEDFFKHAVFGRICGRLGVTNKRFSKETLENEQLLDDFLRAGGLERKDYLDMLRWELARADKRAQAKKFWLWENLKKTIPIGMQWRYGFTVHLDRYSHDLSAADHSEYAKSELIGRQDEYEVLKLVLTRPDQNCALIVAPSGTGKKTLLHFLARRIRQGQEGSGLENTRVLLLDLARAVSDAINSGRDAEDFVRVLLYEAAYAGNIILAIENIEHFLGKEGNVFHPDLSAVMAEFLEMPALRLIATSTPKEYHQLIEKHDQVTKYFEVIEMREPSENETLGILLDSMDKYEKRRVLFTYQALKSIVTQSGKHSWETPLPERALDLAMDVLMFWEKKSDEPFVTEKTVADYLSLKTGVPHGEIDATERKKLLNLEQLLHRQVIGQQEAVRQVAEALRRARSGVGNSQKPVGSFLFLGPTGVGKTEMAKALAKTYFGSEDKMIRLDMSEFQTPGSIDRLLGSSNLNQPGRLVTKIKDNPYSLLLLDEIEKAYPEILDIFLQILDEGFVTDAFGEKINFRGSMIIATSNVGAALIKNMVEQKHSADEIKQAAIDYAVENNIFRLEFLNRFDGVIFFRPLEKGELTSVVRLMLQKFAKRIFKEKNIEIVFGEDLVADIIKKGYNPIFGARSLNRYIEETVEGIIAKKIIAGEVKNGEKIIL